MQADALPELAVVRVLTPGGPYRAGNELSLAFNAQGIGRLVAHDPTIRAACAPVERAVVPEIIAALVLHSPSTYADGDLLTLSFVDPGIARVYASASRNGNGAVTSSAGGSAPAPASAPAEHRPAGLTATVASEPTPAGRAERETQRAEAAALPASPVEAAPDAAGPSAVAGPYAAIAAAPNAPAQRDGTASAATRASAPSPAAPQAVALRAVAPQASVPQSAAQQALAPQAMAQAATAPQATASQRAPSAAASSAAAPPAAAPPAAASSAAAPPAAAPPAAASPAEASSAAAPPAAASSAVTRPAVTPFVTPPEATPPSAASLGKTPHGIPPAAELRRRDRSEANACGPGVSVRLDWSQDRPRRFVSVVDKMFTIDRLGWYRHALAMRLLIPDEIRCGHPGGDHDANLHLQALRAAAVSALGNPLLAACLPNFSVTTAWLDTLEGGAEARAIAGLRDALLPYVEDGADFPLPDPLAAQTVGAVGRRELLALGALGVDAFIPILIPTESHDAKLTRCLHDYRALLMELFGQTARSAESVRTNQMAQPNYSLDDRLWQLAGAVGETFGDRAYAT